MRGNPHSLTRRHAAQLLAAVLPLVVISSASRAAAAEPQWEILEPGLSYCADQIDIPTNLTPVKVHLVRTDFTALRAIVRAPDGNGRVPLSSLARPGDLVVINGGYFEPDGRPSGLVRSGGRTLAKLWGGGSGALLLFGDRAAIIFKKSYPKDAEPSDALQAGPLLVEPGGLPGIHSRTNKSDIRSFVAIPAGGGGLLIGATAGNVDLYDLAEFLRTRHGVGSALNLDGGPSTGFYLHHPKKTVSIEPGWPVPNAISLVRKTP